MAISIRKAAAINAAGKYLKVILTVLVNAVLARILTPYDFGIVAVITVFTTFFATLSDMGLGPAIIQTKQLSDKDINSLFSYSIYIAFLLSGLFALCAFPIAAFYKDAVYLRPCFLLTISLFFNAANMVPGGILARDKKFVTIALRTVLVYAVSAAVAIFLAMRGWRFYALVVQAILTSVLQFVWNWLSTRPRFVLRPSREPLLMVRSYSFYQFAFNVVNYFSRNLDNLLTGKFLGEVNLGNYNKAYNLMLFPVNNLTGVVSPVLHPILSDYRKEPEVIYSRYLRLVRLLFCMGIFVSAFSYLASDEIIGILYGQNWAPCARCFQLLSLAIVPQMINASAGAIFQSIGNTRLLFTCTCINTAVTVLAILAGIFLGNGVETLSLCVALSYIFHFFCAFYFLIVKGFRYSLKAFFASLSREFCILSVMAAAVACFFAFVPAINNIALSALAKLGYLSAIFAPLYLWSRNPR